jgi:hypothetical protein
VLAFPNDLHHAVMNPQQAIAIGERLVREGKALQKMQEKWPEMLLAPTPVSVT